MCIYIVYMYVDVNVIRRHTHLVVVLLHFSYTRYGYMYGTHGLILHDNTACAYTYTYYVIYNINILYHDILYSVILYFDIYAYAFQYIYECTYICILYIYIYIAYISIYIRIYLCIYIHISMAHLHQPPRTLLLAARSSVSVSLLSFARHIST